MSGQIRKKKRVDGYELQALRDVVKTGGDDFLEELEKKFKEVKVEGNKKNHLFSILDLLVIVFLSRSI